jgi:hypothetical protein
MYKVKRKYLGKVLKGGGVSIELSDKLSQNALKWTYNRFGKEYITVVKEKKKDDNDTESPSE